ncbi:hypothetical protein Leryth_011431 [Lithospermum erythrorhizon]|nr:hypothetical protein Leryth_011431 [Lithospermum erythrorhizon]
MEFHIKENHKNSDDHQQRENVFQRLPQEVLIDILSRLPATSLIQFRAKQNNPCLILHCDYPLNNEIYFVEFPDKENQERVKRIQTPFSADMPEFSVIGSCDGILCLVNSLFSDQIYIYNPFTRMYSKLPKSVVFQNQKLLFGFGCHPVSKDYKIIKIIYWPDPRRRTSGGVWEDSPWGFGRLGGRRFMRSEVQVFSLGGEKWRSIGAIPYNLDQLTGVVLVNGRLHWVDHEIVFRGLIVSFDISDEEFREIRMPDQNQCVTRGDYHLAALRGCLSVCIPAFTGLGGGLDIWIMKEYDVKESWVKQFKVGNYLPNIISQEIISQAHSIWRNVLDRRPVRVLRIQDNGDILLEYKGGTLASYDPDKETFKDVIFPGLPSLFQTIVHVGSINWIE